MGLQEDGNTRFDFRFIWNHFPTEPVRFESPSSNLPPIRRIVIGPCLHVADALESVKCLLTRKGYRIKLSGESSGVEVVPSKIQGNRMNLFFWPDWSPFLSRRWCSGR